VKELKKIIKSECALGLVEALVALAVVGTGMIVITHLSLKIIKKARENELQDIAVQTAVEAMEFMKQPGDIQSDVLSACSVASLMDSYKLDVQNNRIITYASVGLYERIGCSGGVINCGPGDVYYVGPFYLMDSLEDEGKFCRQINVVQNGEFSYDIEIIVVWESVGGECEEYVLEGDRIGIIKLDPPCR
jgi:hypothetical protein